MICTRCKRTFSQGTNCPFCGQSARALNSGVLKTSTIVISAGGTDAVYRSVKELPASLRKKLVTSTNGLNSATILIADKRGREVLAEAIQNIPAQTRGGRLNRRWPQLIGILFLLAAAALSWFVFTHRW